MSNSELACVYAALILADDGLEVTGDKIQAICTAANVKVEPFWPTMFAKFFAKKSVDDLISNVGGGGAVVVAAPAAGAAAAAPAAGGAAPAKKAEPESESEQDMGFSLFD